MVRVTKGDALNAAKTCNSIIAASTGEKPVEILRSTLRQKI